ncbi:MAG: hypothetical protein ACRDWY_12935 [Actinomycetes bacterium]
MTSGTLADTSIATSTAESVRLALLSLSSRLESLWREAWESARETPPQTVGRVRWAVAAHRLEEAIGELERYARRMDPTLGRRDWGSRRPD